MSVANRGIWGVGLNIFFRGRNAHQVQEREQNVATSRGPGETGAVQQDLWETDFYTPPVLGGEITSQVYKNNLRGSK